ncbi:DMT family transporter [Planomonospora parontospora]|uniref:DMT family transporter n=1 Tax=Planomonospora parontospora TaxID=58119 RepID=UPI00166F8D6E|nr:EamA family transporter [Planomonospora parontospora]
MTRRGVAATLASAAAFGLMPVLASYAYGTGMSVPTLLALRFTIAAAVFLAWLGARGRLERPTARQWAVLALLGGVMYAVQSLLYFTAVERIAPALAVLLLYLYPALVSVVSAVVERARPGLAVLGPILVSLAGLALVVGPPGADLDLLGVLAAVGSAVSYALYIVVGSRVSAALSPAVTTGYLSMFAAGSFLLLGSAAGGLDLGFATAGWGWVTAVAVLSTVLAMSLFFVGSAALGPVRASLLSMFEPLVAVVATWLLLGGTLSWPQLAGGAVVLAGAAWGVLAAPTPGGEPVPPAGSRVPDAGLDVSAGGDLRNAGASGAPRG